MRSDDVGVLADLLAVDGIVVYMALLRGVNIAGKPQVEMRRLQARSSS